MVELIEQLDTSDKILDLGQPRNSDDVWFLPKHEPNDLPLMHAETSVISHTHAVRNVFRGRGICVYRDDRWPLTSLLNVILPEREGAGWRSDSYSLVRATRSRQGTFRTRNYDISGNLWRVIIRIDKMRKKKSKKRGRKGSLQVDLYQRAIAASNPHGYEMCSASKRNSTRLLPNRMSKPFARF